LYSKVNKIQRHWKLELTKTNRQQQKGHFARQDLHMSLHFPPTLHSTFCLDLEFFKFNSSEL